MQNPQIESERRSLTTVPEGDPLYRVQEVWDAQAKSDPLWAVLSDPERIGRRWDIDTFMATGRAHVSAALRRCAQLGGTFPDRDLALDFGSGVGRLSQALGEHFDVVVGLDIAPTMVAVANRLNRYCDRISYRVNESTRLEGIESGSVTLVFSHITLQHLPSDVARSYLEEFLRVVKPGGVVIFQIPSHFSESYLPASRDDLPVPAEHRKVAIDVLRGTEPLIAGESIELQIDVTNISGEPWTQSAIYPLNIGNHWLNGERGVIEWNDGRARLPGRISPGEIERVTVAVTAPTTPGTYLLQFDVVQEGISWFSDTSEPERHDTPEAVVEILPSAGKPIPEGSPEYFGSSSEASFDDLISSDLLTPPEFEMNAIPRSEVETLISSRGATLLGVDERVNEWHSYTYYVQARGSVHVDEF